MAAAPCSSLILLLLCTLLVAATGGGLINITRILDKAGQYTIFIRLLNITQTADQINNQVNSFNDLTVFAPTDNAFDNLPAGTLNMLSTQQQLQLVLYHICPKYYSLADLTSVSNPVRTQASGQDGVAFGLYFTGQNNQVNVSTGVVDAPIHNVVRKDFPLAVYQVDKVLLPKELFEAKAPAGTKSGGFGSSNGGDATAPSTHNNSGKMTPAAAPMSNGTNSDGGDATVPSAAPTADDTKSDGSRITDAGDAMAPSTQNSGKMSAGVGLVTVVLLLCMGLLS